jgi:hypothetical protein
MSAGLDGPARIQTGLEPEIIPTSEFAANMRRDAEKWKN